MTFGDNIPTEEDIQKQHHSTPGLNHCFRWSNSCQKPICLTHRKREQKEQQEIYDEARCCWHKANHPVYENTKEQDINEHLGTRCQRLTNNIAQGRIEV